MPHEHAAEASRLQAPGVPAEEGVDMADAAKEASVAPEEKKNRTDGADGTGIAESDRFHDTPEDG
ncbi:MAG: hypothetical protein JWN84_3929 [Nocardioides sp.]|nr:hypothetical protein [Nocardioides sp.]